MFIKRFVKIEMIDPENPHAIVELKKRLLQNAALSVALISILHFGEPMAVINDEIPSNLSEYSGKGGKNMQGLIQAVNLGLLAYEEFADIEQTLQANGYENIQFIDNKDTDTQGFICQDAHHTHATIRGTEFTNYRDWLTNVDVVQIKPYPNKAAAVHRGFYKDAVSVFPQIMQYISAFPLKPLCLRGHSQGAAVAQQIGIKIFMSGRSFKNITTAGEPRSMNPYLAAMYGAFISHSIDRVVNNNDIVPRVPKINVDHVHGANVHYFKHDGTYLLDPTDGEYFRDRMRGRFTKGLRKMFSDGFDDHFQAEYKRLVHTLKTHEDVRLLEGMAFGNHISQGS